MCKEQKNTCSIVKYEISAETDYRGWGAPGRQVSRRRPQQGSPEVGNIGSCQSPSLIMSQITKILCPDQLSISQKQSEAWATSVPQSSADNTVIQQFGRLGDLFQSEASCYVLIRGSLALTLKNEFAFCFCRNKNIVFSVQFLFDCLGVCFTLTHSCTLIN